MKNLIYIFSVLFLVSACGNTSAIVSSHVTPESLLDLSSERVSFALESSSSVEELTEWINNDQPTRAEISCNNNLDLCSDAKDVLQQFGVTFNSSTNHEAGDGVVLLYDRIFTRECQKENNTGTGCSVSANMVQMVVDPRQFLDPALLDLQDAEKASKVYGNYLQSNK